MANEINLDGQNQTTPQKCKGRRFGCIAIFTVLIIGLIALLCWEYSYFLELNRHLQNITNDISAQVKQNQNDLLDLQKKTEDSFLAINEQVNKQKQTIDSLTASGQNIRDQLSIAEAEYLVKIANDNLQIGNNVSLVINLLRTADQEISDLNDARLVAIRKALTDDITALQAVPQVDIAGTYLKLAALNVEVDKLPLPNKRPLVQNQNVDDTMDKPWWKRGLEQSWNALRKIIIVRYNEQGAKPFILPEQQDFLYQNIHALYEQAMSAVVHRQPEIYRSSLLQIDSWVKKYFLSDSPVTQAQLKDLADLQTVVLSPSLPNITASLQAFHDYFNENNRSAQTST